MKFSEFKQRFPGKMAKIKKFVSGEDIKDILGTETVNHFKSSFQNEGFTDEVLNPWKERCSTAKSIIPMVRTQRTNRCFQ